nr:hypothetical protein [Pseudomonadota bacterium]
MTLLTFYSSELLDCAPSASATSAPSLARLLAQARETKVDPEGALGWLAPCYGLARQEDWPLAPVRLAAAGIEPGARYWLRATPVHLAAGAHDVRISGAVEDLQAEDSAALVASLATHFAQDGLTIVAASANDWYVGCDLAPALHTTPLSRVLG